MNKSERVAYNWLLTQGYSEDNINFSPRRTPDFITSDGNNWEVKRLYGNTIWLYPNQIEKIKETQATTLVMKNGNEVPTAQIPPQKLKDGTSFGNIRIVVPPASKNKIKVSFYLSEDTYQNLNNYIAMNFAAGYGALSQTVDAAVNAYIQYKTNSEEVNQEECATE